MMGMFVLTQRTLAAVACQQFALDVPVRQAIAKRLDFYTQGHAFLQVQ